ncbi:vam3 target membrane receptor (t-snare) [Stylonychia lemnae]|uniref:Vam3 target membrane receptor (T-snare) n=1 Tax=Stylonychia lemnae TaxID=5949 RepID=A0A078AWL7_STYLE|nr:vam3 target membrane receptor (t-snare) [Stylonychia lemnae]|eukprot:CDW85647.1 vam3 target membrane receptor (t-snare) [Stylonychia lemnae]
MSVGAMSDASSSYQKIEVDKIYLDLNDIDKLNARIKKQLQKYSVLEDQERKETRSNLQKNLKLSSDLQKRVLAVQDENSKMKFENILQKKVKELEVLSSSLVYKEQELLVKYKDQLEENDLEENTHHYEKKGLLDAGSDEDDADDDFCDFQSSEPAMKGDNKYSKISTNSASFNYNESDVTQLDNEESSNLFQHQQKQKQKLKKEDEVEEFQLQSHDQFLKQRTEKIMKVSNSLHQINRMYNQLNEIVVEQGETLTRIEDNFVQSKVNTKKTVKELQKTLSKEKTLKDKIMSCDLQVMCLSIWFIVACTFFFIDLSIASPKVE